MSAPPTHADYQLSQLDQLEAESIHIFREVAAEFEKPVLMFSGGKDSIVMLRLAEKAFYPAKIPFPLLQIDTGLDFPEVLETRDNWVNRLGVRIVVASVEDAITSGVVIDDGKTSRNRMPTATLLNAIEENGVTALFGGGRRDEEKARAQARVYSHRDDFGQWDPKMQRPELWSLYNGRIHGGEHMRIFPLSNWTELDIWHYLGQEQVEIPSIYFSHQRQVFNRDGMWLTESDQNPCKPGEEVVTKTVRFRTVGDLTLTGAVESEADTIPKIIDEVAIAVVTERGATRGDDRFSEAAMEDRKKEGYFCWTCSDSPRPARSTTGSPPSSGGCSSTPSRSSRTSWRPSRPPATRAATTTPTSPC
jgi:sulfate adenylyltransferase subunit 2